MQYALVKFYNIYYANYIDFDLWLHCWACQSPQSLPQLLLEVPKVQLSPQLIHLVLSLLLCSLGSHSHRPQSHLKEQFSGL